jgi:acyl-CoA synthetase (AMP-forming)/AMP-acid ligase II
VSPSDQLPLTVGRLLQARSRTRADHAFLVCDDRALTYTELAERSAALARGLIASGLGAGSRLGLIYPNGPELAVAALAAARIGAIAVPLSTFSTYLELRTLLLNADVDTVIACAGYRSHDYVETLSAAVPKLDLRLQPPLYSPVVPTLRRVVVDMPPRPDVHPGGTLSSVLHAGARVDGQVLRALEDLVQPSDRLVIVHTSGSTADPKGVIHTHGALVNHLHVLNGIRRFTEDDVLFCNSPFFWIGGYAYALLATLESGGTLVCSNADKPSLVLDLIERTRPTIVNGFAQAVAYLPKDPTFARRDLSSIKKGNLYPIMSEEVRPVDPELRHNMLGMTETGSVCLASEDETDQPERRRGSFGRLVPGFEGSVIAVDSEAVQKVGEVGELWLRGPALMDGYCGKERHETFDRDGWYHTGDLFSVDGDGFFYFKGRSGEMIKTSGANVSPREVEAAIWEETGLVSHAFGLDDPSAGQRVVAVVRVPANMTPPDPDLLTSRLRSRLSAYKVPKQLLVIDDDDVPIMSSGKVDIRILKERAHAG